MACLGPGMRRIPWLGSFSLIATTLSAQALPNPDAPETEDLAAHYTRVVRELRSADTSTLDAATRSARARAIDLLERYCARADFGTLQGDELDVRVPRFVDSGDRRCAVADLLDHTGLGDLTLDVSARANGAWVCELAAEPRLRDWLITNGLSLAEAARIQAPNRVPFARPRPVVKITPYVPSDARPKPTAQRSTARPKSAGQSAAATNVGVRNGTTTGTTPRTPQGVPMVDSAMPANWSSWWTFHRGSYLTHPLAPITGADRTGLAVELLEPARRELLPLVAQLLRSSDAEVRAEAASALAALAPTTAIDVLVPVLSDPHQEVREAVILALGRTGAPRAVRLLSQLACANPESSSAPSPYARGLALAALGLGSTFDASSFVAALAADPMLDADAIPGLVAFDRLSAPVAPTVDATFASGRERPAGTRALATAMLPRHTADVALPKLMNALSSRDLEVRRAAALALARVNDPLASAGLMTAIELERELGTRGMALVALGARADRSARGFLREMLGSGGKSLQPWAALAAGLHLRGDFDVVLADALRDAERVHADHSSDGAFAIALGLSRDPLAVPALETMLRSGSPEARAAAAEALGVHGSPNAMAAVRKAITTEKCPVVRISIAEALACSRDDRDANQVLARLADAPDPDSLRRAAAACMRMPCEAMLRGLFAMVRSDSSDGMPRRAYALRALAELLAQSPARPLARSAEWVDWVVLPSWFVSAVVFR